MPITIGAKNNQSQKQNNACENHYKWHHDGLPA
jgi:hypothetical protein